jgi:amidase
MLDDVILRSALAQSQLVRGGAISAEELTRAYLDRIERLDPKLSAFVQLTPERAVASARALDRRRRARGERRGPLWGLPTAMKDIHQVRGMFLRLGSRAFRYLWSPVDDASTAAVRRAGMVLTGKLSTSELAILPVVDTELHPPTRNPWDLGRYSGGSSGGSAAALAAGLLPVAVASDGAGSIRIPAAFCGLVGHKPTRGLIPNPFAPFEPLELSVIGPHARSVDDAVALMDALRSDEEGNLFDAVRRPPPRLRIRFTTRNPVTDVDPLVAGAVERVAGLLSAMGHEVDEGTPVQGSIDEFLPMFFFLARGVFVPFEGALQETTRWLRRQGERVTLQEAMACRELFRGRVDRWFGGVDLWITPTVARLPPAVGAFQNESAEGRMYAAAPLGAFTAVFNASGHPATTIPLWGPESTLPVGVQLVAPRGQDARSLAVARALLEALGTPLTPLAPLAAQA